LLCGANSLWVGRKDPRGMSVKARLERVRVCCEGATMPPCAEGVWVCSGDIRCEKEEGRRFFKSGGGCGRHSPKGGRDAGVPHNRDQKNLMHFYVKKFQP